MKISALSLSLSFKCCSRVAGLGLRAQCRYRVASVQNFMFESRVDASQKAHNRHFWYWNIRKHRDYCCDSLAPPEPLHEVLHPAIRFIGVAMAPFEPRRSFKDMLGWLTMLLHPAYWQCQLGADVQMHSSRRRSMLTPFQCRLHTSAVCTQRSVCLCLRGWPYMQFEISQTDWSAHFRHTKQNTCTAEIELHNFRTSRAPP